MSERIDQAITQNYPPAQASAVPTFRPRERFLRVLGFFLGVVVHVYVWDIFLARFGLLRWYVQRTSLRRWARMAHHFRHLAVKLGGIHIKLGQFLSSRADIVPEAVRAELAGLQDEVPAAPSSYVLDMITETFGVSPYELFATFEDKAVAAASFGQVHFATLHGGRSVAVKVQRPYIEETVEVDLSALLWVVRLIKDYRAIRRRADLQALFEEFARVLRQELDYVQEARNAELFRANFADYPGIYVPEPITELTTRQVMVMERVSGLKVSDLNALTAAGVDLHDLAERLNETYLKQFFLDGFFHADPHPGNLFVRIEPDTPPLPPPNGRVRRNGRLNGSLLPFSPFGRNGTSSSANTPPSLGKRGTPFTLIFLDFGMVGYLTPQTMEHMRDGVIGLATNDAERMVRAMENARMILPGADKRPIIQAVQVMMRYSYDRTVRELNNLDVEAIFDETQDLVYDLPFQLPQDLLYLGRAMSMVGGLATAIEPDINLFESLRPFARYIIDKERREADWLGRAQQELQELGQIMLTLPRQMDTYYKAANRGELQTRTDLSRLERTMRRVEHTNDRLSSSMLAAGLFVGGVQLRSQGLDKEARRAWWAAALTLAWSLRPRGNDRR